MQRYSYSAVILLDRGVNQVGECSVTGLSDEETTHDQAEL